MYMERKFLKESNSLEWILLAGAFTPAAIWIANGLRKTIKKWFTGIGGNDDIFELMFKDKEFIKELTRIIEEEGGIYDFLDKGKLFIQNVANKNIPVIIDKILSSSSFKKYITKYKLEKKDIQSFGDGLYFILTNPDFKRNYSQMLQDVGEDITHATRAMNDREKRKFFNLDDGKISLKSLLPKQ
jgi:hypothetical protein